MVPVADNFPAGLLAKPEGKMSLFPRHQNFWHLLLYISKWIRILALTLLKVFYHYASQLLGQVFTKCCITLSRSHTKPLNWLLLWRLLTCNTILKAASCAGNSVVLAFSSCTGVVCSSLLYYPLGLVVYYSYFSLADASPVWTSFSSSFFISPKYFPWTIFFSLSMPRKESSCFHHCKNELSMANFLCRRNGHQMRQTEKICSHEPFKKKSRIVLVWWFSK